jgi:hypothetical protein
MLTLTGRRTDNHRIWQTDIQTHVQLRKRGMRLLLFIILILLLIGLLPTWPYSTGFGYYPSGGVGFVLLIVIILALLGRI